MPRHYTWIVLTLFLARSSTWEVLVDIQSPYSGQCSSPQVSVSLVVGVVNANTDDFLEAHKDVLNCALLDGDLNHLECHFLNLTYPHRFYSLLPGCHSIQSLLLHGNGLRVAASQPVQFQVSQDLLCDVSHPLCPTNTSELVLDKASDALFDQKPAPTFKIVSPRPFDVVYSEHVIIELQLAESTGNVVELCAPVCFDVFTQSVYPHETGTNEASLGGFCMMPNNTEFVELNLRNKNLQGHSYSGKKSVNITATIFCPDHDDPLIASVSFFLIDFIAGTIDDIIIPEKKLWRDDGAKLRRLSEIDAVLLLSHFDEDLSWLVHQPFPAIVYEKDTKRSKEGLHAVKVNVGNEATAFLKYIIDYYDDLPLRTIFLHSHRYAYHQEDAMILLPKINEWLFELLDQGLYESDKGTAGYCNINNLVWGDKEEVRQKMVLDNWNWLGKYLGAKPSYFLDRCCAQMIVHRNRIRLQPREFYVESFSKVSLFGRENETQSRMYGLLFEWIWHYIFGEEAVNPGFNDLLVLMKTQDRIGIPFRPQCVNFTTTVKHTI